MPTTIRMTLWGAQDGSELACEAGWQKQEALISRHVQHALAPRMPTLRKPSICIAEDCHMRAGKRRYGYAMSIIITVDAQPATPAAIRALECQMESLVCMALLELLRSIEVESVEVIEAEMEDGDGTLSA